MLKDLFNEENLYGLNAVLKDIRDGVPAAVFGVDFNKKCALLAAYDKPFIFIVNNPEVAKKAVKEINALSGGGAAYLPPKGDMLLFKPVFDKENLFLRLSALDDIKSRGLSVVTTMEALLQPLPLNLPRVVFKKGEEYPLETAVKNLVYTGYRRVETVENKGEFSLRGDLMEIYPVNFDDIYRIDFFGDDVERIKVFGEDKELEILAVVSATDVIFGENEEAKVLDSLKKCVKKFASQEAAKKAMGLYAKLSEKLENDLSDDSLQYVLPLLKNSTHDFFKAFGGDYAVVLDEPKNLYDLFRGLIKEHAERVDLLVRGGDGLSFIADAYPTESEFLTRIKSGRVAAFQSLTTLIPFFSPLKTYNIAPGAIQKYAFKTDDLIADVKNWIRGGYTVVIAGGSAAGAETVYDKLISGGVNTKYVKEVDGNAFNPVTVSEEYLPSGFIFHECKLVFIGTDDIFLKSKTGDKSVKKRRGDLFNAPKVGDFAVHENFGVGVVRGVKRINTVEGGKDYVELEYYGGDRLYVATDQMDKLTRYLGGSEAPALSKIGGGEFERVKERVRASIRKMTVNLKKLYKARAEKKGFKFSENGELMDEFLAAFEYEDTEDQAASWQEISADMESGKVMDRLLCGDVGFGKTEVAFRACFKAILDLKQAAIVAPTTILTEQHYENAVKRFKGFGVRIGVLNRFRTAKEQQKTITALKNGEIDLIIGTHRMFSKDVGFKDLGLLVVDEEQRFGVEHKEKLKLLKENVDTLTLSATPIPRTLHMSLSGIRDISTISTPPKNRLPVQTIVSELTPSLIADAVSREISRGGQTFILFNRVEKIFAFKDKVQNILPNAKIVVAHGQMQEKELEKNVRDFYLGAYDVLIATTIIENGIDMPRANTLIVTDADKLGLSTLYQLKGRVGRGGLTAYAYFTFDENKVLTEPSFKRLSALAEYSEMGSGYKIAMRDLELRGAGNVLGKEQHGHMDKVGYELYGKLLKEELNEHTLGYETELDVKADAYIPESYIANEKARMEAYKQIAEIKNDEDKTRVVNSLNELYGDVPRETLALIDIAELKIEAQKRELEKVVISRKLTAIYLSDLDALKKFGFIDKINAYKNAATLSFADTPVITFDQSAFGGVSPVDFVKNFLRYEKTGA